MPTNRITSLLLVVVQFASLAGILATGPMLPRSLPGLVLVGLGVVTGLWALAAMPPRTLHVLPDVRPTATLAVHGPYRWIRHPMYSALLCATLGLLTERVSWIRVAFWLVLAVDLWIKLGYEEARLTERFPDYPAYRTRTTRLIPFLL